MLFNKVGVLRENMGFFEIKFFSPYTMSLLLNAKERFVDEDYVGLT